MVEVHLYGKLRRHAADTRANKESIVRLERRPEETVRSALERVGIAREEICHLFLNGAIFTTQNSMAPWLEYQKARAEGWDTPLSDGDRLGVFGHDMALLVV